MQTIPLEPRTRPMKRRFLALPDGSASTFTAFKGDKSPPVRILDALILHTRQPKMCKINKLKEEEGRARCRHGYARRSLGRVSSDAGPGLPISNAEEPGRASLH